MRRKSLALSQALVAVGLLGMGGCWVDFSDIDQCNGFYETDSFGWCQYCDCWGCYTTDDAFCNGTGGGACLDDTCLEGCYYDDASGGCIETAICSSDFDCLSGEICDIDRSTCVPADRPACTGGEAGFCGDLVDNDQDGFADCDDLDCCTDGLCAGVGVCGGVEDCSDWQDNDFDGLIDCEDQDCAEDPSCGVGGFCGDGVIDAGEECDDGNNVDGDGCSAACTLEIASCDHDVCTEGGPLDPSCDPCAAAVCAVDDFCCTSAWDAICVSEAEQLCGGVCSGGVEVCDDGLDNDGDGAVDCGDDDCSADPTCSSTEQCILDDVDLDGLVDDILCVDPSTLCVTIDYDADGTVDYQSCDEPGCIGVDTNNDGLVDVIDCTNNTGCIGIDFENDGVIDQIVCDPNQGVGACQPVDQSGDGVAEFFDCTNGTLIGDFDGDGFLDDTALVHEAQSCAIVDLDSDGTIDDNTCF
jgi:hypothetical protein